VDPTVCLFDGRALGLLSYAVLMCAAVADSTFFLEQAKDEALDERLYAELAGRAKDDDARRLLESLAGQERRHLEFWARLSGIEPARVPVSRLRLGAALFSSWLLGQGFTVRRLERQEDKTIAKYERILQSGALAPEDTEELRTIVEDERTHEREMEQRIADERLAYLGAAVLGLNDALIELTGGLTGLVSSITDTELIGFTGLVIGVAASLSMAASNFLSSGMSAGQEELNPTKAAAYTGVAYIVVVVALVAPFFAIGNRVTALVVTWAIAVLVICAFAYYSAVLQNASFTRRVGQMLALGLGVAVITYLIGRAVSAAVGISV
jgi:VIT1/CCC1 family predicted Fe2+/Mn2+ transporter